jgi:hypothetical protein
MDILMNLNHAGIVLEQKQLTCTKFDCIVSNVIDFSYISAILKGKISNKFIPCDFIAYFNTFSNLFKPGPNSRPPAVSHLFVTRPVTGPYMKTHDLRRVFCRYTDR